MNDLTNEQKILLSEMYKDYLIRLDTLPNEKANFFNSSKEITNQYFQNKSVSYVSELCWKLKRKDYINCSPGDNLANNISLTDKTIIYFENRFKNNLSKLGKFINLLR